MKRKIVNPFIKQHAEGEFQCFGCSPINNIGLQMNFYDLGDSIETKWIPKKHFEGFFHVLHGGIQSTVQDEIASWVVFTKCKTSGVTKELKITFHHPVYVTDSEIRITAELVKQEEKSAMIHTKLYNSEGKLCSEAMVEYFIFPVAIAKRKHGYPGVAAFYESGT